ncbi:LysR family transcriptional regulator [Rhodococcus sp. NPDC059968]|uniref:LysR family transcriptional regulator n=1 Tax=Rhodococcus sp. NPDC059968 TaxID=3347017 RepID=UPI003671ACB2
MDFRSLTYFESVARLQSVSSAAAECIVSQPAISKQIAGLETRLGVKLFHRASTGMVLTPAGRKLYELSADILHRARHAETVMRAMYRDEPQLTAVTQETTAHFLLAPFIAETGAPIIDLRTVRPYDVDRTLDEDADLAVGTHRPPDHRECRTVSVSPVLVQCAPQEAAHFDDAGLVELAAVSGSDVLVPGHGSGVELAVRSASARHGIKLESARSVNSPTVAQALAANGRGLALVTDPPRFGVRAFPLVVDGHPIEVPIYLSWDRDHYATNLIAALGDDLRAWLAAQPPWISMAG